MNENTSPPENLQEPDQQKGKVSADSTQENLQQQVHAKLDKCDTLIDLLEDNGIPEVSSKETTSGATAYPEFGNPVSTKTSSGNISLQLKICTTEISDSKARQIAAGTILTSHESIEQTVEILWEGKVVGTGYLYADNNCYVIKIAELSDITQITQQGFAYEI